MKKNELILREVPVSISLDDIIFDKTFKNSISYSETIKGSSNDFLINRILEKIFKPKGEFINQFLFSDIELKFSIILNEVRKHKSNIFYIYKFSMIEDQIFLMLQFEGDEEIINGYESTLSFLLSTFPTYELK